MGTIRSGPIKWGRDLTQDGTHASAEARRADLRAYAYLTLAFVFMALNIVMGRVAADIVPPFGLSFWRWVIASLLFLPFAWAKVRDQRRLLLTHWRMLLFVSVVMVPLGNNLIYVGLQDTTALNGGLIAAARPAMILIIVWLLFRGTVTRAQWVGIVIAAVGVLTVLTRGDLSVLGAMRFNRGDLWMIAAAAGVAAYQSSISRVTRDIHPNALLQVTMVLGACMMLPLYVWETLSGRPVIPTGDAIALILFVAIVPSIFAVYLINRGIAAVGPARMGIFNYLPPIFVAAISIPLLGETLNWYHPVSFAIVALGIIVATRRRRNE